MSRSGRLLLLVLCTLVLAACGGGTSGTPTSTATLVTPGATAPTGCYLIVFLIEDVTKEQILQVQKQLLANRLVAQVSFVPKALVLSRFAKTNPETARGFVYNPFSDRFDVVPRTHGSTFSIIAGFAEHGGPITNVKPSDACGQAS